MKKADSYYKIRLRPKHYDEYEAVDVYIKGDKKKLVQFLADIGDTFRVDILDVNTDGYIHNVDTIGIATYFDISEEAEKK